MTKPLVARHVWLSEGFDTADLKMLSRCSKSRALVVGGREFDV